MSKIKIAIIIFVCMFFCLAEVSAHDPAADPKDPEAWDASIHLGFNLTDGNSDTSLLNVGAKAEREKDSNIWRFEAEHSNGENDSETNVDSSNALADYKRLLTDRFYVGFGTSYFRDEISDVKYRVSINPNVGYYLLKEEKMSFRVEAGPSYLFEEVAGISDDYLAPRVGERFEYQFSETAKFFQEAYVTFDADNSDNYLIDAEAGIEAALVNNISLVVSVQDDYDNLPALGLKRNDIKVLTSLAYQL